MKLSTIIPKFTVPQILFGIFIWSQLILRFGYRFGTGDQVELLPYTLFLHDPILYAHDFFIQGLNATVPNERTVMAYLLLPFVNCLEIACFLLHLLFTVILVLGMERIATYLLKNQYLAWAAVWFTLMPLNDFGLGNVELYSDCLQASSVATAVVVWGIWLFLQRRFLLSSVLMSVATFIQVLDGLDVMIILCVLMLVLFIKKQVTIKQFLTFAVIYACTAGLYLLWIFAGKQNTADISNAELFQILFEFRHPHHFIFASFSKLKVVVFTGLTIAGLVYYWRNNRVLFLLMASGLIGIVLYAIAVDGLHNVFIANFQFYKISQWMKFWGVVAVLGLLYPKILPELNQWPKYKWEAGVLAVIILMSWGVILGAHSMLPYKVPFELFGMKQQDDMIAICEKIKEVTPKDAVFIQPFDNTELKYYGQRSSYVEFKANVRHKKYIADWYHRIQLVYGVGLAEVNSGFALREKANHNYLSADPELVHSFRLLGITHMLVDKQYNFPSGKLILENNTYAVYQF